MENYLNVEQIKELQNLIQIKYDDIIELKKIIEKKYTEINQIKDHLINFCNHNKQIDTGSRGEHTEYYCTICQMNF